MRTTLKLVASRNAHRPIMAWLVSGSGPREWLAELSAWGVPLESLQFHPIPHSVSDATPIGVLVTSERITSNGGADTDGNWTQRSGKKAIPYTEVVGRLLIPIDAELFPEISDRDLSALLPDKDSELIWHPAAGLIRFEPTDRCGIADLLIGPREVSAEWNLAVPGISFPSRVISVKAEQTRSADDVLKSAASDIGSRAQAFEQLPPTPDEPFGGKLNNWTKAIRDAWRKLIGRRPPSPNKGDQNEDQTGSKPADPQRSSWATRAAGVLGAGLALPLAAAGWAAGKLWKSAQANSFVDQLSRSREIERLMHLLKSDPDQGLQFAIPMGGNSSRGIAPASNQLVARPVGFNLGMLGGGGPADVWDISHDRQEQLIQQYRELAAREIRLGRHRRAAYIYAQLLNDLVSAAGALEAGQHFESAAILYRDRLNRPVEAARCFERAGLLDIAVHLYIQVEMFEQAADLYVRLERQDEAEQLLRSWVSQLLKKGDFRNASRVLHDKLDDLDGALDALSHGWRLSSPGTWYFGEIFRLLGLHAHHQQARERIAKFKQGSANGHVVKMIVDGLASVSSSYPDQVVRADAVDAAQVVAAKVLRTAGPKDASELLDAIRRLAPEDRLLARDCTRYLSARQQVPKPILQRQARGIQWVSSTLMTRSNVEWRVARSTLKSIYLAGFADGSLVLQRMEWQSLADQSQHVLWKGVSDAGELILEPFPGDDWDPLVHVVGAGPLEKQILPTNKSGSVTMKAGTPSWVTATTLAIASGEGGIGARIREDFGTLVLALFSPRGEPWLVKDLAIPFDSEHIGMNRISLLARSRRVRVGLGPYLCRPDLKSGKSDDDFELEHVKLEAEIHGLVGSRIDNEQWIIALFETGACLIDDNDHEIQIPIAQTLESPRATFLHGGQFVVASGHYIRAYEIVGSYPVVVGECITSMNAIAVTATNKLGEFAVIGETGAIEIFRL